MYITGITGASGSIIGVRLVEELLKAGKEVTAIVTDTAWKVISHEVFRGRHCPASIAEVIVRRGAEVPTGLLREEHNGNFFSPAASGSNHFDAVIIAPCSMKTLSAVASGFADTLMTRVVDIALKENRQAILVPRETPLNRIHLENMLRAKDAGADIVPPMPAFYTNPETVDDIIDCIVGKVLSLMKIDHSLYRKWAGND
ncbi:MAG TPA: UbiX family flavin prenyltransferase [Spirochaetota bacterium]|nr:UbiX family flavin prenyltransferase [Spirochaetota bacterium]